MKFCPQCAIQMRGVDGYLDPKTAERRYSARPCGHELDAQQAVAARNAGLPVEVPRVDGASLIAAERARQPAEEGWTPEHDAEHTGNELAWAAWCYLDRAVGEHDPNDTEPHGMWPWEARFWKPGKSPLRLLIVAGALIAAEIDKRLTQGEKP